jgi:hypothetical protein
MEEPMDTCRLRVKIGPYEMEAEGPRDFVEKHYGSFSERIPQTGQQIVPVHQNQQATAPNEGLGVGSLDSEFRDIYKVDGKIVTLTSKPTGTDSEFDGLLLILFGQREMRGNDLVSADELLNGMKQSGFTVDRTDRLAGRAEAAGLITRAGVRRGTKYRLTNPGVDRAAKAAQQLLGVL